MSARTSAAAPVRAQAFEIVPRHKGGHEWLARVETCSVALAFVNGEIGLPRTALTGAIQITSASQPSGHLRALTSPMKQGINLVIDRSSPGHDQETRVFSPKLRREHSIEDRWTRNIPNESRREQ